MDLVKKFYTFIPHKTMAWKNETENMMESIDVAVYITICNIQLKLETIL